MLDIYHKYGLRGLVKLWFDILFTKIFFSRQRIVRRPVYIRGKRFIKFSGRLTTGINLRIDAFPISKGYVLEIGENVEINDYVHIGAIQSVKIGNNVLLASKVFITDHNHGVYSGSGFHDNPETPPRDRKWNCSPVEIGDNVWIGELVTILPGSKIGNGSIVGAMSLVNSEIPPFSIAVGIPAKVIRRFNFESQLWERV